jgi:N-acetyl-beta-hexosaminidase
MVSNGYIPLVTVTRMKKMGYTSPNQLVQYFEGKLQPMIKSFGKTFVGWQEIFDAYGLTLPADTIIEVWEDEGKEKKIKCIYFVRYSH